VDAVPQMIPEWNSNRESRNNIIINGKQKTFEAFRFNPENDNISDRRTGKARYFVCPEDIRNNLEPPLFGFVNFCAMIFDKKIFFKWCALVDPREWKDSIDDKTKFRYILCTNLLTMCNRPVDKAIIYDRRLDKFNIVFSE
jgi:hypothetical protein